MDKADARALLQSTQQLRTHWSGAIITLLGYVAVANAAIWSYFLKAYVDSSQPLYIAVASAGSSMSLALWRYYVRQLDDFIAALYPEFLFYEGILSVPNNYSTTRYLIKAVPNVHTILENSKLNQEQKCDAISNLVESKRIGIRGHLKFEIMVLSLIVLMFGACVYLSRHHLMAFRTDVCLFVILVALCITLYELFTFQRNPDDKAVQKAIRAVNSQPS